MVIAERMDEGGKAAWIVATVLGFWAFWPIGVALLVFLGATGRLRAWRRHGVGRWHNMQQGNGCSWGKWNQQPPASGNRAFDEYRAETLKRLEDEQREFVDYLERLRQAKDKAEFDQFMADRRRPTTTQDPAAA